MFRRLLFAIFFCFGGFLFYVPKWILMGTKGSRDRKRIISQQRDILRGIKADSSGAVIPRGTVGDERLSVNAALREARRMQRA